MKSITGSKMKNDGATKRFIATCTIPTFILYAIFVIYPIFNMIGLSFVKWNGLLGKKTFYGLQNYKILFQKRPFLYLRTIEKNKKESTFYPHFTDKSYSLFRSFSNYVHCRATNPFCQYRDNTQKLCLFFSNKNEFFARIPVFCNAVMTRKVL